MLLNGEIITPSHISATCFTKQKPKRCCNSATSPTFVKTLQEKLPTCHKTAFFPAFVIKHVLEFDVPKKSNRNSGSRYSEILALVFGTLSLYKAKRVAASSSGSF